jgi:hypothetical protein
MNAVGVSCGICVDPQAGQGVSCVGCCELNGQREAR